MRVLACPTEFKGTLSARQAARAIARGVRGVRPDASLEVLPLSDGGPGLLDALLAAGPRAGDPADAAEIGGAGPIDGAGDRSGAPRPRVVRTAVADPLGRETEARLLFPASAGEVEPEARRRIAVAESADACGLHHLHEGERRPLETGTEGVGELIRAAAERGAELLYLGMGGSATCDGGAGAARRLGWGFLDDRGGRLSSGGGALERLARMTEPEEDPLRADREARMELVALADVRNPLLGPRGAARTFGPQKGAGPEEVRRLELGLSRLASLSPRPDLRDRPGSGAAGGLAFGCGALLGASIVPGAPWLLRRLGFRERLARADRLVTGEGAYDQTTGMGKIVNEVLSRARRAGVPAAIVCGRIDEDPPHGVEARDGAGAELDADGLAEIVRELAEAW